MSQNENYEFREYFLERWGSGQQFDVRETRRRLGAIRACSRERAVRLVGILANRGGWGKAASLAGGECAFKVARIDGFLVGLDKSPLVLLDKAGNVVDEDFKG
jgi:hypothetical protein